MHPVREKDVQGPDPITASHTKRKVAVNLKNVMTYNVEVVEPEATVHSAATLMKESGIGSLPVVVDEQLVGMLTDRDIVVRVVDKGLDPNTTKVREVMTAHVVYCFIDQSIDKVMRLMEEERLHRLPVLNRNDRLIGIVSATDLAVHGGAKRLVGEVLERVEAGRSFRRLQPYRHIVVALDGSENAEQILPYVAPLATKFGSIVTLMRVITPLEGALLGDPPADATVSGNPAVPLTPITKNMRADAIQYLTAIQDRLRAHDVNASCEHPEGRPAEAIVQRTRHLGAGLIAMTTHGRTGLGRTIMGSVADEVLRTAPCPLLLIRAQDG
jgi:CBS domain-containing protein/nucleotide-binding universal stress UspA family protein